MPKRLGVLLFLAFSVLFLVVERAAYKGYFQDDELETVSWAPRVHLAQYGEALLSPRFLDDNFRPAGHFYFLAAEHWFGLKFPGWVAMLQAIHLFNVWLLWILIRRLGAPPLAAAAACLFFGLHMALIDAVWKPMYVFDVLCATFCLLALIFHSQRRWVAAFAAFWLAYKAKEVAVMLPLVMAAAELWFGKGEWKRRWVPLAPFFLASLSFGLQGILLNPNRDNAYTFRFTAAALAQCGAFYASRVFLIPYAGLALPLAAIVWRQRRVWFGLVAMAILLAPLLFLPGRLFAAYCYVPFVGLAIAFSGVAERLHPAALIAFFLLWTPLEIRELRAERKSTLALDDRIREWVMPVARFAASGQRPKAVLYDGEVRGFAEWGMRGAVHYLFHDLELPLISVRAPEAGPLLHAPQVALLTWDNSDRLSIRFKAAGGDVSFLEMDGADTAAHLGEGWYGLEGKYRWTGPRAAARLYRPAGTTRFQVRLLIVPQQIEKLRRVTVRVALGDRQLEARTLTSAGWQTADWELTPAAAGPVTVALSVDPAFQAPPDVRILGVAVAEMGFIGSPR